MNNTLNILILNENFEEIKNYIVENINTLFIADNGMKINLWEKKLSSWFYNTANYIAQNFQKYNLAIILYKEALLYDNKDAQIYNNLATTYKRLKDFDQAIYYYEKCIELDPNSHIRYLRPASLYAYTWDIKNAEKFLRLAKSKSTSNMAFEIEFNHYCETTSEWWRELKVIYDKIF